MENPFADLIPAGRKPLEITIPGPNRSVAQQNPFADLIPQQQSNETAKRDLRAPPTRTDSFIVGATDAATFGFGDEILGAIDAAMEKAGGNPEAFWDLYKKGKDRSEAYRASTQAENPGTYLGGQFAGGLGTAALPAGQVVKGATLLAKAGRGATVGAGYGGLYGVGSGEGLEGRLESGSEGAMTGAIVGAGLAPIAAGIGKLAGKVKQAFTERAVAREAGVNRNALQKVTEAFKTDRETGLLREPQKGDLLMNMGPQLQSSAEAIATQPGAGSNILLKAGREQSEQAGSRVRDLIDRTLGRDKGRVLDKSGVEAERKAAGRLYDVARASGTRVDASPARQALQSVLDEADGSIRSSIANTTSRLKVFSGNGPVTARELHAARIEIDDAMREAGLGSNKARLLRGVRDSLDDALKNNVRGYREADQAYATALASKDALQAGRDVFTRAFGSPDELTAELDAMAPAVRERFLKGARDAVSVMMGTARNDAAAVRRELLEKGWNREKLEILVGKGNAQLINKGLEAEANRAAGRHALEGNSRTAMRNASQKMFPGEVDASQVGEKLQLTGITGMGLRMLTAMANKLTGGAVTNRINASRRATSEGGAKLLSQKVTESDVLKVLAAAERAKGKALNVKDQYEALTNAFGMSANQALQAR